jgi:hypothetical protein
MNEYFDRINVSEVMHVIGEGFGNTVICYFKCNFTSNSNMPLDGENLKFSNYRNRKIPTRQFDTNK